jgi:hypothetical protein
MLSMSDGQTVKKMRALLAVVAAHEASNGSRGARRRSALLSPGQRHALSTYFEAHERVLKARETVKREWQLDFALLSLDAEYQRHRARVRYESGLAPGLPHLSGPRSLAAKLRALQTLRELLPASAKKTKQSTLSPDFAEQAALVLKSGKNPIYRKLAALGEQRARALGPALAVFEALTHSQLTGVQPSGPGAAAAGSSGDDHWAASVVKINRNGGFAGTGFFVTSTLVVTAAHVVQTPRTPPPNAGELSIDLPTGETLNVLSVAPNPSWNAGMPTFDTALLATSSVDGLGLPVVWDFGNHVAVEVARFGYPSDGSDGYGIGVVERAGGTFTTRNSAMQIPAGASGCPLLYGIQGVTHAVGVGTARSAGSSSSAVFIGLPMLPQLFPGI